MMKLICTNPNRTLVRSATLTQIHERSWYLQVSTIYNDSSSGHLTERAAKQFMGREFQKGAKWSRSET